VSQHLHRRPTQKTPKQLWPQVVKKLFGHPYQQPVVRVLKMTPMQRQARASKPLLLVPNPPEGWNKKSVVV
jgi:hypothetical protein